MTNMVEPTKVAANTLEVLASIRQKPVMPHA